MPVIVTEYFEYLHDLSYSRNFLELSFKIRAFF